jgi:hypothetical protein
MSTLFSKSNRTHHSDLQKLVEPLASYICATDRPRAALKAALAALAGEVEETNRAARAGVASFAESRLAMSA